MAGPPSRDWWHDFPWRLIQTNLREIDMRDIHAERVARDLSGFHASILMINAAGIIASYPTRLPFHFQSPYLTGDSLADIIAACHDAGIRVFARTDFSKVRRPIFEQHPEWAYRTAAGEIVDYNGDVHVCLNSDYQQKCVLQILEECLSMHNFDGIFFNMGGYVTSDYSGTRYGPCHCDNCRRRFGDMFHLDLPAIEDMEDPVYRKYCQFKRTTQQEQQRRIYDFLEERWPHLCIANHRHARRGFIRQESNTAIERPLPHWQYDASENTKWAVGSYPGMVSSNTTVDFIDFPYRHVAVSPHQQRLRLMQSLANGGALDFYLIGRLDNHEDRSGFAPVREMFAWHARHEADYHRLRSRATIALLRGPGGSTPEFRGWFRTLLENHFLFDVLLTEAAPEAPWEKYTAIILPDIQPISDSLAAKIDRFVQAGGTIVATGQCGILDEDHEARPRPALRCLGIDAIERVRMDMRSSCFRIDLPQGFPRLAETDLVYMDGPYLEARFSAPAAVEKRLRLIPPQPFGPPERCYSTGITDDPGLMIHRFGRGRALWLPWLPGRLFYRQGHTNTVCFMADVLEQIARLSPITGNLPPTIEVTWFEQPHTGNHLVHLVNTNGHLGNTFYAPTAVRDLTLILPIKDKPAAAGCLVSGRPVLCEPAEDGIRITVPCVEAFEAIRIDFRGDR